MKKIITTASLIALFAIPAAAQDAATSPAPTPATQHEMTGAKADSKTMADAGQISAKELLNKNVRNGSSDVVGDINDIRVDSSGKITSVIVGVGGFLGLGEKNVALPYEQLTFARDDDGALVVSADLTKESLQAMPEWKNPDKNT